VQTPIPANGVARFNLSRAQATALAGRLVDALEQNSQDSTEVLPPYDYGDEFSHIIAKGLGISQAIAAEGLGIRGGRCQRQNRGRGGQPQQLLDTRHPTNPPQPQAHVRRPAHRPVSPVLVGFEHNQGPAYIPFQIHNDTGSETPACYIHAHLDAPNPFVEGRLSLNSPTYHSEIHADAIHDVDIPPPPITAKLLQLLHTDYMDHACVDEAMGELGDRSLIAKVNRYRRLERKCRSFEESIRRLEDQMFTTDIERWMCISRLEAARALVQIQNEMQQNRQAFRLSPWSLECGHLP
jgi:hypothetical protein